MKSYLWPVLFPTLFSLPTYASSALDEPTKAEMHDETGHRHDESGKAHATHGHAVSCAGQPGKASRVTRTIRMQALDTMRYAPEKLTVKSGQTVRFIVTNAGKIKHEFVIGDAEEQRQHAEMMKEAPDMKHGGQRSVPGTWRNQGAYLAIRETWQRGGGMPPTRSL
jgi:plastocyanin